MDIPSVFKQIFNLPKLHETPSPMFYLQVAKSRLKVFGCQKLLNPFYIQEVWDKGKAREKEWTGSGDGECVEVEDRIGEKWELRSVNEEVRLGREVFAGRMWRELEGEKNWVMIKERKEKLETEKEKREGAGNAEERMRWIWEATKEGNSLKGKGKERRCGRLSVKREDVKRGGRNKWKWRGEESEQGMKQRRKIWGRLVKGERGRDVKRWQEKRK